MRQRALCSRRRFLAIGVASAGAAALAACQSPPAPTVPGPVGPGNPTPAPTPQVVEKIVTQVVEREKVVEKPVVVTATPPPAFKGSATVWTFPQTQDDVASIWKPLGERMKKRYPELDVKTEVLPWAGRREKMMTAFASGEPPDAAYVNTDTLSLFGSNDVLQDLTPLIPKEVWDDYPEGVVKTGLSWKGKRLMIPTLLIITGRLANQELLSASGWDAEKPPATWADALKLGAQAKEKGYFLTSWTLSDWGSWVRTVWQAAGTVYSDDLTKVQLNQPAAEEALNFMVELFQKGYVPREGAVGSEQEAAAVTAVDYFVTGKQVLSAESNPSVVDTVHAQAPKMKYTILPPLKGKEQVTGASAGCWGIFNKSKNTAAAARWINFVVEPENQGFYCSAGGFAPPRQSANTYWTAQADLKKFVTLQLPFTRINQDMNYFWQEGKTTSTPYFQAAVLGKTSVKQALADATRDLQKQVDAFWAKQKQ
jgi:multiple sugar transport system substrate-binding protein